MSKKFQEAIAAVAARNLRKFIGISCLQPVDKTAALNCVEVLEENADAARAQGALQNNLRETFEALCAMRDTINEHIPLPSLESDLLQGPETSVFCSVVAEAVITALQSARAQGAEVEPTRRHYISRNCGTRMDGKRVTVLTENDETIAFKWEDSETPRHLGVEEFHRRFYLSPSAPQPTEREKVLEEALRPFAERANRYNEIPGLIQFSDDVELWQDAKNKGMEIDITVGDLRRARAALTGGEA